MNGVYIYIYIYICVCVFTSPREYDGGGVETMKKYVHAYFVSVTRCFFGHGGDAQTKALQFSLEILNGRECMHFPFVVRVYVYCSSLWSRAIHRFLHGADEHESIFFYG